MHTYVPTIWSIVKVCKYLLLFYTYVGVLADALKACQLCGNPLYLKDCVGEKKFGLAHILSVSFRCWYSECGLVNDVPIGSRHNDKYLYKCMGCQHQIGCWCKLFCFLYFLISLNTDYFLIKPTNKPR